METLLAGDINERGYVNSFKRRGFTPAKCLLELGANVLDSMDKMPQSSIKGLTFVVEREYIKMIDTAGGMNKDGATAMFSIHNENHSSDSSRGVSGLGAKPSMFILSQETPVDIYTRKIDGDFIHICAPWDEIWRLGKYTGMVKITSMTEEEKEVFMAERETSHGTTIRFRYNDILKNIIEANFTSSTSSELTNPLDRFEFVFGRDDIVMLYKHYEDGIKELEQYNYFSGTDADFYRGRSEATIHQYTRGTDTRFIWMKGDEMMEILKRGSGVAKTAALSVANLIGYTCIGKYTIKTGLRVDSEIFNPIQPAFPQNGAFGKNINNDTFLGSYKLVRNNQLIGLVLPPDHTIAAARGAAESWLKHILVQTDISFNPISSQNNAQDMAMNIQENKNQFDGTSLPKQFTRLVKSIHEEKAAEIEAYFIEMTRPVPPPVVPPPDIPPPVVPQPDVPQPDVPQPDVPPPVVPPPDVPPPVVPPPVVPQPLVPQAVLPLLVVPQPVVPSPAGGDGGDGGDNDENDDNVLDMVNSDSILVQLERIAMFFHENIGEYNDRNTLSLYDTLKKYGET